MKSYLLILLSTFGLLFLISSNAPEINKDISTVVEANQEQSIEVSLLSEKTTVPKTEFKDLATTPTTISSVRKVTSTPKTPAIQGYTITRVTSDLVASPSYRDIYRTGRLVYAHNTDSLFGRLRYLRVGNSITLTEGGVTTTYRISDIGYFTKVPYTNARGITGENLARCDASYNNCSGIWMGNLVNNGAGHALALMTCDGGRNTPNRLIIFAD